MNKKDLSTFRKSVNGCRASKSLGTVYDGGIEFQHGLVEGSEPCICLASGNNGTGFHFQDDRGMIYPSLWEVPLITSVHN